MENVGEQTRLTVTVENAWRLVGWYVAWIEHANESNVRRITATQTLADLIIK